MLEVEFLTNPRVRDEVGDVQRVPSEERVSGPGTGVVMGAFTHVHPEGSRFSDGTYGAFYAGRELDTAVMESKYQELFLRATTQGSMELDMRASGVDLAGELHDLRGRQWDDADVHAENDHAASRRLAAALREDGSNGLVYDKRSTWGWPVRGSVSSAGALESSPHKAPVLRLGWKGGGVGLREAVLAVVGTAGCSGPVSAFALTSRWNRPALRPPVA